MTVFGISISEHSPLVNKSISENAHLNPNLTFKPIALHRNDDTINPSTRTLYCVQTILYTSFLDQIQSPQVTQVCGKVTFEIKDVMILGGSRIGVQTARLLEEDYNVILVEKDRVKCEKIAGQLKRTLVVNIDGHDVEGLEDEGLADMDAFIAVTGDSETNYNDIFGCQKPRCKKDDC